MRSFRPAVSRVRSHRHEASTGRFFVEAIERRALWAASTTAIGVQFFFEFSDLSSSAVAGVVPQRHFNTIASGNGESFPGTSGSLVNGAGVSTGITLTHNASDGGFIVGLDNTPNALLLTSADKTGGADNADGAQTGTYTFNHVPAGTYTLIAYTQSDTAATANLLAGGTVYFINDQTSIGSGTPAFTRAKSTDAAHRDTGNYVQFDGLTPDADGAITLTNVGIGSSAAINGLQLVPTALPASTVAATLSGKTLTVTGTSASDKIGLDLKDGVIRVAATSLGGVFKTFKPSAVTGIVINAGGATDKVDVDPSLSINATLIGGTGNDVMLGGSGNDSLEGDAGRDRLIGRLGADTFSGGAGNDTVEYGDRTAAQPINVSLDGIANDGGVGENDSVGTDIENVFGGLGNDTLTGNGSANILVGNRGADHLIGLGGSDTLVGYYASRTADGLADTLDGGSGTDTFINDTLDVLLNNP